MLMSPADDFHLSKKSHFTSSSGKQKAFEKNQIIEHRPGMKNYEKN